MSRETEKTHIVAACAVEASPPEVDAGASLTLKAQVSCIPPLDLTGHSLVVRDHDGADVGEFTFAEFDGEASRTGELVVKAPVATGSFTWVAVLPAHDSDGLSYAECATPFSFTVKPHATTAMVWDVPSAIERGEKFTVKVGVKCSSACPPTGWGIAIHDHDRKLLATATVGDKPWRNTASLYFAEVELTAPDSEGTHRWKATAPVTEVDIPHAEGAAEFGVTAVAPPECLVTIEAIDQKSQAPVRGAKVIVHPYRAFTDERGVARLRVPRGAFTVFVSGKKYVPFQVMGEVSADMTIKAELVDDVGLSVADIWA